MVRGRISERKPCFPQWVEPGETEGLGAKKGLNEANRNAKKVVQEGLPGSGPRLRCEM